MIRSEHLGEDLDSGEATVADVDRAVERVVSTRMRFADILDQPVPGREELANPAHRALAREAAAKSVVLLRNESVDGTPLLPLAIGPNASIALLGTLAGAVNLGDGGSSDVWAPQVVTPADGIRSALPGVTVIEDDGSDLQGAASLAATADVAIVVVGYTRLDEGEFIGEFATAHLGHLFPGDDDPALVEAFNAQIADERKIQPPAHAAPGGAAGFAVGGDRSSLHLHDEDIALIRAVSAVNPRTVVALVAGSAVVISEWDTEVPAVVQSWYSGMEGGHGLADVLLGTVDATGRLPFSVPRSASDLPAFERDAEHFTYDAWHGYWHLERNGVAPAYPFGFGLSYTTIALEGAEAALEDGVIHVSATLHNHGARSGSDVVQVYAHRQGADRPARLVGFARVEVEEGESRSIDIAIPTTTLAERDLESHSMVVRPGTYRLRVARHAVDPGIERSVDIGR